MSVRTLVSAVALSAAMMIAPAAWADSADVGVRLRADVTASGPLVTLGDLFENAGAAAARPIGPAPRQGATATFLPRVVENAARAAGLDWTAPSGLTLISVRNGGAAPTTASSARIYASATPPANAAAADIVIRRGDLVSLAYTAPGVRLTARTRAQSDATVGAPVRLTNLQSNRTLDAIAVGPGRATANLHAD